MKKLIFVIVLIIANFSCKDNSQSQQIAEVPYDQNGLNSAIENTIQKYLDLNIFSGIVLVAEEGELMYHKAFGLADRALNQPNTLNTLFDIGSMNKTFTSIVVKQLAAEGKLNMNDRLVDHVSGFTDSNAKHITLTHLLEHQSGFGDYHTRDYFDLPKSERSLNAIVERAKSTPLYFEPGTEEEYSNLGYVILGAVIESSSGKSYFDNVKERIVDPLQLKNTYLNNFEDLDMRIAKGYYYSPLGELIEGTPTQDEPNPDGGFLSTTEDIMTFYRSYYYDDLLLTKAMKSKDPMFEYLSKLPEGKATGAAGGFEGFNTALFQVLSDDLTIIVFANMDEPVAEHIALDILALTRGQSPEPPKPPAIQNVRVAFEEKGLEYIKTNFENLTTNFHPEDPKDWILNALGYAYLYEGENKEKAIKLFKLNTELFPDVANCWDSYGEALLKSGFKKEAEVAYNRALEIKPDLESAINALKSL